MYRLKLKRKMQKLKQQIKIQNFFDNLKLIWWQPLLEVY